MARDWRHVRLKRRATFAFCRTYPTRWAAVVTAAADVSWSAAAVSAGLIIRTTAATGYGVALRHTGLARIAAAFAWVQTEIAKNRTAVLTRGHARGECS